jgi:hypothetical protein
MKEWLEIGTHQVNAILGCDADFQNLSKQLVFAEKQYRTVIEKLSPIELEIIENYIALCEEVEYQKTRTAYYCGKRNG